MVIGVSAQVGRCSAQHCFGDDKRRERSIEDVRGPNGELIARSYMLYARTAGALKTFRYARPRSSRGGAIVGAPQTQPTVLSHNYWSEDLRG